MKLTAANLAALVAEVRATQHADDLCDRVKHALAPLVCMGGCCDTATHGIGRSVTSRYCDRHAPARAKPLAGVAAIRELDAWMNCL